MTDLDDSMIYNAQEDVLYPHRMNAFIISLNSPPCVRIIM
jgi:hypothetical protein